MFTPSKPQRDGLDRGNFISVARSGKRCSDFFGWTSRRRPVSSRAGISLLMSILSPGFWWGQTANASVLGENYGFSQDLISFPTGFTTRDKPIFQCLTFFRSGLHYFVYLDLVRENTRLPFMVDASRDLKERHDQLADLHHRLVEGDPAAPELLAITLLSQLPQRLRHLFPASDQQMVADAVSDALLQYLRRPCTFNAAKSRTLETYLLMAASRNLLNRFKSEFSRKRREERWVSSLQHNSVANYLLSRNTQLDETQLFILILSRPTESISPDYRTTQQANVCSQHP